MYTFAMIALVIVVASYLIIRSDSDPSEARAQSHDDSTFAYMMIAMASNHSASESHHCHDVGQGHLNNPSMSHDTCGHADVGGYPESGSNLDAGGHDFG
jgi:ABC-type nickel/cobalt efflux system permease component RcnA